MSQNNIDMTPLLGLEVFLILASFIFAITLFVLLAVLFPPTCCARRESDPEGYPRSRINSSSSGNTQSTGTTYDDYAPRDSESFFIPADRVASRDKFRAKIIGQQKSSRRDRVRSTRDEEEFIHSTMYPEIPAIVKKNRHFPGLQEISRISFTEERDRLMNVQVARVYRKYKKPEMPTRSSRSHVRANPAGSIPRTSPFVV
jgi:hypothetical protein